VLLRSVELTVISGRDAVVMSALPKADIPRHHLDVSFGPILLQKSFCIIDHEISWL